MDVYSIFVANIFQQQETAHDLRLWLTMKAARRRDKNYGNHSFTLRVESSKMARKSSPSFARVEILTKEWMVEIALAKSACKNISLGIPWQ